MSFASFDSPSRPSTPWRRLPPEVRRLIAIGAAVFSATLAAGLLLGWVFDFASSLGRDAPADSGDAPVADVPAPFADAPAAEPRAPAAPSAFAHVRLPTDRADLFDAPVTNAFVATNEEIPETALYGSARTGSDGRSRFHKGIDIAPVLPRSRKGEATDPVYAVAPGRVLYVNRVAGNSSYGLYVVLLHNDPVGEVYTLYAHLASVAGGIRTGAAVAAGDTLGVMGRSANSPIPTWRAHLHFETGLMLSSRFGEWERRNRQTPPRGNGHGWNLMAANPLDFLRDATARGASFSMLDWLRSRPVACEVVLPLAVLPDYFRRHRPLWTGAPLPPGGADAVLSLTDSGLILSGRLATPEESAALAALPAKGPRIAVLSADEAALGRNGMRIVVKDRGAWRFGSNPTAQRWLELLRL